jgi:hypothetical protein
MKRLLKKFGASATLPLAKVAVPGAEGSKDQAELKLAS